MTTPTCATCGFWSRWLPSAGDCLRHAYMRRHEFLHDLPARAARSAEMTGEDDTCRHHATLDAVLAMLHRDDATLYDGGERP